MKIFAIQENKEKALTLGYLFYYEKAKEFYIELLEGLDEWDVPLILSSLYKNGIRTIDSYWSKKWVQQRIIPSDRQNIAQILHDNKLKYYDEFSLLILANGRCEQDDYYIREMSEPCLAGQIVNRQGKKITNIQLLDEQNLLVFFKNGIVSKCNLNICFKSRNIANVFKKDKNLFSKAEILPGGFGIGWPYDISIMYMDLWEISEVLPVETDSFEKYLENNILSTSEAMKMLCCSRQYINELVKTGALNPIKKLDSTTLFSKKDVLNVMWK